MSGLLGYDFFKTRSADDSAPSEPAPEPSELECVLLDLARLRKERDELAAACRDLVDFYAIPFVVTPIVLEPVLARARAALAKVTP